MKKLIFAVIALISLAGILLAGCTVVDNPFGVGIIVGSGSIVNKGYEYIDFDSVDVGNNFEYEIVQSNAFSMVVSTHENIVEHLDVYQTGTTVFIRLERGSYSHTDAKVVITMPNLNKLVVSGASRGSAHGFQSTNDFELRVSGASQLDIVMETGNAEVYVSGASKVTGDLKALDARISVSGASRCELDGSAKLAEVKVSGASQVNMPYLEMADADVNLSGASKATINTQGTLNLEVSGASILNYTGNPILSKVNVTGASKIYNK